MIAVNKISYFHEQGLLYCGRYGHNFLLFFCKKKATAEK